ncbi:ribosomal L1 domain-containing protein 1-like [Cucurbita maxima]|uniref:Ribosomal L1 domain-containing protein 1-like n=1 Tax=Cucurbita maxima TaxID=3661 RepID=A0A6J1HY99_CUCMA|nr:ribosomal L1 domain-containing protein 1-like [Cucurbita maxima]
MASSDSVALSSRVRRETAEKAVESLLQWRNSKREKPQLFDLEDFLYLVVALKKIPPKGRTNPYKIPLPHSLRSDSSEICLIIDDRSRSNLTKDDARKKIQSENIPISKVIKLSKLKSDYRPFEAKRKLCDSYDMFFADDRVIPLLPSLLGKHFYKKKKIPVPLNLRHKNWKEQIERSCSSALLYLRTGTCSVVKVAKTSMEVEEIVSNVIAAIDGIAEIVPKKWSNVRSFHLKVLESIALPIYQTVPELKLKIDAAVKGDEKGTEKEDEAGKSPTPVKVSNKKEKKSRMKKGRIHEVRYMDSNGGELSDEDDLNGDLDEDMDNAEVSENLKKGSDELKRKTRSRVNKGKEELQNDLSSEKTLKKSTGVKKDDSVKQKKDKISTKKDDSVKQKKDKVAAKKKDGGNIKQKEDEDEGSAGKKVKKSGVSKSKAADGTKVKTKKLKAMK